MILATLIYFKGYGIGLIIFVNFLKSQNECLHGHVMIIFMTRPSS